MDGTGPERVWVQVIDVDVAADREVTFGRNLAQELAAVAGVSRSGCGRRGKDQQVKNSHLGEPDIAPRELLPDRSQRRPVAVEVAFVAAYEFERTLPEQSLGPGVVVL